MPPKAALLFFAALSLFLVIIFTRPSTAVPSPAPTLAAQEKEEADVAIKVVPLNLAVGSQPRFEVFFDTHSVELDFEVAQSVSLFTDQGELGPATWAGSSPGGHHRQGTLSFESPLVSTKNLALIFKDIGGVSERRFSWSL